MVPVVLTHRLPGFVLCTRQTLTIPTFWWHWRPLEILQVTCHGIRLTCFNILWPSQVVLVGMGADEQLGGYSRHRVKYRYTVDFPLLNVHLPEQGPLSGNLGQRWNLVEWLALLFCSSQGWAGLVQELQMEIERISSRNLGRDDRIISDHAREARLPFLDESVVSFLNSLPMCKKVTAWWGLGGPRQLCNPGHSFRGMLESWWVTTWPLKESHAWIFCVSTETVTLNPIGWKFDVHFWVGMCTW